MSDNNAPDTAQLMEQILYEVKRVVVGQDRFLERVMVAMLAQGHLLVEGVPGLAKTLTVKTLASVVQGRFKRIQFTPDLVPADLVGTRIYNQKTGDFSTALGPVFANLLLADEINRAPAKVQSALLEVMQERQVTIAGESHKVPSPFLVMATQNPIETEGTYPLPEAQVDRFMMKVLVDYPTDEEEYVIVERVTGPAVQVQAVATTDQLAALQALCRQVFVDPALVQYAVRLVSATRTPEKHGLKDTARFITYGASPRATIGLVEGARALAMLRGRNYALPEDMSLVLACHGRNESDFPAVSHPRVERVLLQDETPRQWQRQRWLRWGAQALARQKGCDVYFTPKGFLPGLWGAPMGVRTCAVVHDLIPLWYAEHQPGYFPRTELAVLAHELRRTCRHADRLVTISEASADDILARVPDTSRPVVVYNGLPPAPRHVVLPTRAPFIFAMASSFPQEWRR